MNVFMVFIIGFIAGALFGVFLLALLQANHVNEEDE